MTARRLSPEQMREARAWIEDAFEDAPADLTDDEVAHGIEAHYEGGISQFLADAPEDTDLNLVILCGRLAVDAELRTFDSGTRLIRYLVTTRVDYPRRRVDVLPVTLWDPPAEILDALPEKGERVWICGSVQRRYWESPDGRRSRVEVVAEQVNTRPLDAPKVTA